MCGGGGGGGGGGSLYQVHPNICIPPKIKSSLEVTPNKITSPKISIPPKDKFFCKLTKISKFKILNSYKISHVLIKLEQIQ